MCLILRHHPDRVKIMLDEYGFIPVSRLITAVQKHSHYTWIDQEILIRIVDDDPKGRYEIVDNKIRARYGHSFAIKEEITSEDPPSLPPMLYHGTSEKAAILIRKEGIKAQSRRFVHLSDTVEIAQSVGKRHAKSGKVIVFKIDVPTAISEGIHFKRVGKGVYISKTIPCHLITTI